MIDSSSRGQIRERPTAGGDTATGMTGRPARLAAVAVTAACLLMLSACGGQVAYLSEAPYVDSYCEPFYAGSANINGRTYARSLKGSTYCGEQWEDFNLSRRHRRFVSTVGMDDTSRSGSAARFEVFADGRLIHTVDLGIGATRQVDVDVTNVFRLRLRTTQLTSVRGRPAWGDARIVT